MENNTNIPAEKTVAQSEIKMTELVLPNDTNVLGNLLGGRLLHWVDIAGALAAQRHSQSAVVTASIEGVDFRHPIRMGEMVLLAARVVWTGRTSMKVYVDVQAENVFSGKVIHTNKAELTFVAVNSDGRPIPVPKIKPVTDEERALFEIIQMKYDRLKG